MTVHSSPFAGRWYPAEAGELEMLLEAAFERSRERTGPHLLPGALGFVVPHAGPLYSGTVAAAAYRSIALDRPERVVVLGFPHHGGLSGVAVPDAEAISTPFGEVPIAHDFGAAFPTIGEERVCDHSFEIQLPFLQKAAPQARIAPLYVGSMDAAQRAAAADALASAWRPGTVLVASSDFTHYGQTFGHVPFPPDSAAREHLRQLDAEYIEAAGSLDSALFLSTLSEHHATVCGADPIALLLEVLARLGGDAMYQTTLDYQASGEIAGDFRHSVSYAALAFHPRAAFDLSAADGQALLTSAAETLRCLRETRVRRPVPVADPSPALRMRRGAFVTLHQGDELLGCVGNTTGRKPLAEEAATLLLSAALDDPRFDPAAEIEGPIGIEISVLTPMRRITGIAGFRPGRHGGFLKQGSRAALLLPQVATEHSWDAAQFLETLARKCRLGARAWEHPEARLYTFEAQIIRRPEC
jgi:MEMO1 family protein